MARKDLIRHALPSEHEEEVCGLLERFGEIKAPAYLADYLGVSMIALTSFLRSNKAKAAAARHCPESKRYATLDVQGPPTEHDPALLDEYAELKDETHGYSIFDPAPGGTFYLKK